MTGLLLTLSVANSDGTLSTKPSQVRVGLGGSLGIFTVHLIGVQPGWSPNQTYNAQVLPRGSKTFSLAELEHQDLKLESFNQMVKKAVDAKAKLALRPRSSTKKMHQHCPRGN